MAQNRGDFNRGVLGGVRLRLGPQRAVRKSLETLSRRGFNLGLSREESF